MLFVKDLSRMTAFGAQFSLHAIPAAAAAGNISALSRQR